MDLAALGFVIDSAPLARAREGLDHISASAHAAERSTASFSATTSQAASATEAAMRRQAAAVNDNARAVGLARHEWVNLGRQMTDVATSLAGGASPFMVLTQQGGQIADVFSSSKAGATGAIKDFLATTARIAIRAAPFAAVTGAVYETVTAVTAYQSRVDDLTRSLNGLGRASGLTVTQLQSLANANAGRLSNASAQQLAGQFVGAGAPASAIGGAIGATQEISRKLGVEFETIAKQMAGALADPAKGAEEMAKRYGLVSFAQEKHIRELAAVGDRSGAAAALIAEVNRNLKDLEDPTWKVTDAFSAVGKAFSDLNSSLGKAIQEGFLGSAEVARREAEAQRRATEGRARAEADAAARRQEELNVLRDNGALAVREIQARSFAEREAVATQKAYANTLRETNDVVKASIAAENERARLAAESQRKIDDIGKSLRDREALSGLSPFARSQKEIEFKYRDLRQELLPSSATMPVISSMTNVATSAQHAAAALENVASAASGRMGRLIPMSEWQGESSARRAPLGRVSDPRGVAPYIRERAIAYGIDPEIALRVARSEGLGSFIGDAGSSFGAFQLHRGGIARGGNRVGGLGDEFMRETGLDPANPANERETIDFALRKARQLGWRPFHGAARVGIGEFEGIGAGRRGVGVIDVSRPRQANDNSANDNVSASQLDDFERREKTLDQYERGQKVIEDYNAGIERQRAALGAQSQAFGQSTEEMARAQAQQELINQLTQQGVPLTNALRQSVAAAAENYGRFAGETERAKDAQQRMIAPMNALRDLSKDFAGGFESDMIRGEKASVALEHALSRLAERLASLALDSAIDQIFGKSGTSGAGTLGGGLFGALRSLLGFAEGGVMTSHGPLPLRTYAGGGIANTPQLAMFGEGSRPEAYVPLPDGRSIPVTMRGGNDNRNAAGGGSSVVVNVIGAPPGAKVEEKTDAKGGRRIDVIIDERNAASLMSRHGQTAMAQYGLAPKRARRG